MFSSQQVPISKGVVMNISYFFDNEDVLFLQVEEINLRTSLVVQWPRLCTLNTGALGSIPGQGTRSHMLQLRVCMAQLKIPHACLKILHATTKIQCSQISKNK